MQGTHAAAVRLTPLPALHVGAAERFGAQWSVVSDEGFFGLYSGCVGVWRKCTQVNPLPTKAKCSRPRGHRGSVRTTHTESRR